MEAVFSRSENANLAWYVLEQSTKQVIPLDGSDPKQVRMNFLLELTYKFYTNGILSTPMTFSALTGAVASLGLSIKSSDLHIFALEFAQEHPNLEITINYEKFATGIKLLMTKPSLSIESDMNFLFRELKSVDLIGNIKYPDLYHILVETMLPSKLSKKEYNIFLNELLNDEAKQLTEFIGKKSFSPSKVVRKSYEISINKLHSLLKNL